MRQELPSGREFSFARRPAPVPGDLRITWRLSLLLLMLSSSRGKRASLAKLHVLNHALRYRGARRSLEDVVALDAPALNWRMTVEPALGRAIDFLVGEKLAEWTQVSNRRGLRLTPSGLKSAELVEAADDVLLEERSFLKETARQVTETFVTGLLASGGSPR